MMIVGAWCAAWGLWLGDGAGVGAGLLITSVALVASDARGEE